MLFDNKHIEFENANPRKIRVSIDHKGLISLKPQIANKLGFVKGSTFLLATSEKPGHLHFVKTESDVKIALILKYTNKINLTHVFDAGRIKLDYKNINHKYELIEEVYDDEPVPGRVNKGDVVITLKPIAAVPRKIYTKKAKKKYKWHEIYSTGRSDKDGRSKTRFYKFYKYMMDSCHSTDGQYHKKFVVHEDWKFDFWKFHDFADSLYQKDKLEIKNSGKIFSRIDHHKDFTPDNLAYHTWQQIAWKRDSTHEIEVDGVIKHVSEIHQILEMQGISVDESTVRERAAKGKFTGEVNKTYGRYLHEGEYQSLKQICKNKGGNYPRTKHWISKGKTIDEAIELSKTNHQPEVIYLYNGVEYNQNQLSIILAKELGAFPETITQRLREGMTIEEIKNKPFRKSRSKREK